MIETGALLLDSGVACKYLRPAKQEGDVIRFFHTGGIDDIDGTSERLLLSDCES